MPILSDWRRRWRHRRTPPGPLRDYLDQPLPSPRADYREVDYLAIDLETTGLDQRQDLILSVGYVVLHGPEIDLSTARHHLVRIDRSIPEASAVIHQITDDQAATGRELEDVLGETLAALAGRVMIAHHASIEQGFLSNACKRCWGQALPLRIVDTQTLAHRTLERRQIPFKASDLRLHALTSRYNLPRHGAHNALSDALSAAELFLAQAAYRDDGRRLRLSEFLC
ncbi:3'-5' exonuclease [Allochromatium humboldtianum]|jgi:DNA polymerase III subunit epsilon|uniref:3'-5' exonuclease n=1 Tax=Allochromatium humboldtianum TaxID=504901 RepID=A0A850RB99_9GAMM|nr:exonuclease domain-containing protein [Allochromatium humboldtianum]NVZ09596.1 3'-5' exonuclease [Allochromatium humboldtianum]